MDSNRRNLLKAGASAAVGSLLAGRAERAGASPPPTAHRSSRCRRWPAKSACASPPARLGPCTASRAWSLVLDNGSMVDLQAEARRQKMKLAFDPALDARPDQERQRRLRPGCAPWPSAPPRQGRPPADRRRRALHCRRSPAPTATSTASAGTTWTTSRKARTRAPTRRVRKAARPPGVLHQGARTP